MNLKYFINKNRPGLLATSGVILLLSGTVVAIRNAKRAEEELEKLPEEATIPDKLIAVAPALGPVIGLSAIGTGLIILSLRESGRREDALMALYAVGAATTDRWKAAVLENLPAKKAEEVRKSVVSPREEIPSAIINEPGPTFFDTFSGRYFKAKSVESIRSAVNTANDLMFGEDFVSLNEFYENFKLPRTEYGEELGFNVIDGKIELIFDSFIHNDEAVISLSFVKEPKSPS